MFERFTAAARQVVSEAVVLAQESPLSEVRPEHLLRAVLDVGGPAADALEASGGALSSLRTELDRRRLEYVDGLDADDAEALAVLGIDLDEVVRRIDRNLGASRTRRPGRGAPRLSRASKQVLEHALREAVALRHGQIGSEHLLLGLVRGGDRIVLDTLTACGVDPASLRGRVAGGGRRAG